MSRSRKKVPVFGFCSDNRKQDRILANRKFRRKERQAIEAEEDPPEKVEEVSDIWTWTCDGKCYRKNTSEEYLRK